MVIMAVKMHRVIRKPLYVPCFDNISSVRKLKISLIQIMPKKLQVKIKIEFVVALLIGIKTYKSLHFLMDTTIE